MSEHPASHCLRSRSAANLVAAIADDLVSGTDEWRQDPRDLMVSLAPYHDCARRLGLDVALVFRSAADRGPKDLRSVAVEFGERDDVTLGAFGLELEDGVDGPEYRLDASWGCDFEDLERWLEP